MLRPGLGSHTPAWARLFPAWACTFPSLSLEPKKKSAWGGLRPRPRLFRELSNQIESIYSHVVVGGMGVIVGCYDVGIYNICQ
jgi:hypothetical protein